MAGLRIDYAAASGLEPHHPSLGLGFWSAELGRAKLSGGDLVTWDVFSDDYRGGRGRYYRREFTDEEFNDATALRVEVTLRVMESLGSAAATSVQFTTPDGKTFGLGFFRDTAEPEQDQVFLCADDGRDLPRLGQHGWQDLWESPAILGSYAMPVNVMRTYVLELLRGGSAGSDGVVQLQVADSDLEPLKANLGDLNSRVAVPGLVFGHPVIAGRGAAAWRQLTIATTGRPRAPSLPRRIGNRRQLFLDDWIVEECSNLKREIGKPAKYAGNPVMRRDKPWDRAPCDLYSNAVWDPENQKLGLYYSSSSTPACVDDRVAYAESSDGGHTWVKPDLGLYAFGDHQHTNIVLPSVNRCVAGPCVFRDEHDPDPSRRYKLLAGDYGVDPGNVGYGIHVAYSPDGIHWRRSERNPVLPMLSDTAQSAFWDERTSRYVAYVRAKLVPHDRCVARIESDDFEHWTLPEVCFVAPYMMYYSMGVTPYQGIYIGTPWVWWRRVKKRDGKHDPVISPGLAASRDGWSWQQLFVGEQLLPTGPVGADDERQIRMSSTMVVMQDRILLLYGMSPDPHVHDMRVDVGLATLRLDGFVALAGSGEPGRLVTKPFVLEGETLYVNAACDAGGQISVAVLGEDGSVLEGLGHEQCEAVRGDGLQTQVTWRGGSALLGLRNQALRLEFRLNDARLYAFWVC